ncbi:hypothetical protein Noda2021_06070 [Candidatus Dependentiae bacterium Noda2021]|nr:hypothetical protein Noda2021_06070 [Candidatus Dependentiae bacterium Noda2021]
MKSMYYAVFASLLLCSITQAFERPIENLILKLARVKNSSTQTISLAVLKPTRGTEAPFVTLQPEEEVENVLVPLDIRGGAQFAVLDGSGNARLAIGFTPNAADGNARVQMREVGVAKPLQDFVLTAQEIQAKRESAQTRGKVYRGIAINLDVTGDPRTQKLTIVAAPAA